MSSDPSTPTVVRSSIAMILLAIKTALLSRGVVATMDAILVVAKRNQPDHSYPDKDIVIRVSDSRFVWDEGGGRYNGKKARTITIYARTGLAFDKGLTDEQWLEVQDAFEDAILDALVDLPLFDANGNALTTECLHAPQQSAPQKDDDDFWGDGLYAFDVHYQPQIDPTYNGQAS